VRAKKAREGLPEGPVVKLSENDGFLRATFFWHKKCEWPPAEFAARFCGDSKNHEAVVTLETTHARHRHCPIKSTCTPRIGFGSVAATSRTGDCRDSQQLDATHLCGPRGCRRAAIPSSAELDRRAPLRGMADRKSEVRYLADLVGIADMYAGKSPEEKLEIVKVETSRAKTIFVGDGINDAPALTAATVGIAFGQNSDVTTEAADVVIMDSMLTKVD
jgi:hypothetical protein